MNISQALALCVSSAVSAVLAVTLTPRARHSPVFDRVLLAASFLIAFIGAWLAANYALQFDALNSINQIAVDSLPLIPLIAGALGGALLLNLPLWLMDRFGQEEFADEVIADAPEPNGDGKRDGMD